MQITSRNACLIHKHCKGKQQMKNPFRKHTARHIAPMPSWEEIVPMMYDKGLDGRSDEIIREVKK